MRYSNLAHGLAIKGLAFLHTALETDARYLASPEEWKTVKVHRTAGEAVLALVNDEIPTINVMHYLAMGGHRVLGLFGPFREDDQSVIEKTVLDRGLPPALLLAVVSAPEPHPRAALDWTDARSVLERYVDAHHQLLNEYPRTNSHRPDLLAQYAGTRIRHLAALGKNDFYMFVWNLIALGWCMSRLIDGGLLCDICFRRCGFGHTRCDWHQRGARDAPKDVERRRNVRLAFRALKRLERNSLNEWTFTRQLLSRMAAESLLLSKVPKPVLDACGDEAVRLIRAYPIISERLPTRIADARGASVIQMLHDEIDPVETWAPAWIGKLAAAVQFFSAEQEVAAPRRGKGSETAHRVQQAVSLHRAGIQGKDIARQMGVTPARVSQWLKEGRTSTQTRLAVSLL